MQGQQPNLRPVAVGDDHAMLARDGRDRRSRRRDVVPLGRRLGGLAAPQQRVAAQGDDHPHHATVPFLKPASTASTTSARLGAPMSANS